jgi:hypothetical protein
MITAKKRGYFQRRGICIVSNEGRLHNERALYRAQPTTHPLFGGDTISPVLRWTKDTVVDVGEGPDGRIGSRSSGNGTKLVSWVENLSHSMLEKKKVVYG